MQDQYVMTVFQYVGTLVQYVGIMAQYVDIEVHYPNQTRTPRANTKQISKDTQKIELYTNAMRRGCR